MWYRTLIMATFGNAPMILFKQKSGILIRQKMRTQGVNCQLLKVNFWTERKSNTFRMTLALQCLDWHFLLSITINCQQKLRKCSLYLHSKILSVMCSKLRMKTPNWRQWCRFEFIQFLSFSQISCIIDKCLTLF